VKCLNIFSFPQVCILWLFSFVCMIGITFNILKL
jgi:hypothetical protein